MTRSRSSGLSDTDPAAAWHSSSWAMFIKPSLITNLLRVVVVKLDMNDPLPRPEANTPERRWASDSRATPPRGGLFLFTPSLPQRAYVFERNLPKQARGILVGPGARNLAIHGAIRSDRPRQAPAQERHRHATPWFTR